MKDVYHVPSVLETCILIQYIGALERTLCNACILAGFKRPQRGGTRLHPHTSPAHELDKNAQRLMRLSKAIAKRWRKWRRWHESLPELAHAFRNLVRARNLVAEAKAFLSDQRDNYEYARHALVCAQYRCIQRAEVGWRVHIPSIPLRRQPLRHTVLIHYFLVALHEWRQKRARLRLARQILAIAEGRAIAPYMAYRDLYRANLRLQRVLPRRMRKSGQQLEEILLQIG